VLEIADTLVVVVDMQERLARVIHEHDALIDATRRLVAGAKVLGMPVVATEQNPAGLGATVGAVAGLLTEPTIPKRAFSCCGEPAFVAALDRLGRRQVLLAGIEAHVCVYQTAADLLAAGRRVHVVVDAVGSRTPANRAIGIEKMKAAGAAVTSVETALFELLKVAEGPRFKEILRLVK
jgi:nicotinamidase-related amidase